VARRTHFIYQFVGKRTENLKLNSVAIPFHAAEENPFHTAERAAEYKASRAPTLSISSCLLTGEPAATSRRKFLTRDRKGSPILTFRFPALKKMSYRGNFRLRVTPAPLIEYDAGRGARSVVVKRKRASVLPLACT
jgi:hypothetical protein